VLVEHHGRLGRLDATGRGGAALGRLDADLGRLDPAVGRVRRAARATPHWAGHRLLGRERAPVAHGPRPTACHGWRSVDTTGRQHDNSASQITCNPDGSFSFTQYAGNLGCSGSGVTKTYRLNVCEQDTPPTLYTTAVDLTCCANPSSAACVRATPSVSVAGATIYLDGAACP